MHAWPMVCAPQPAQVCHGLIISMMEPSGKQGCVAVGLLRSRCVGAVRGRWSGDSDPPQPLRHLP